MAVARVGRRTLTLLILAVVSGVLLAGLTLPFIGGLGLITKAAGNSLTKIGSCPSTPPLPQRSVMLAADGSVIATLAGAEDRVVVSAAAIPPVMQYAIVAIEDNRFYEHKGVDLRGVLRAASADTTSGAYDQGASTITEQYVKLAEVELAGQNKVAQKQATEKSLDRKLTDARCAIALEKKLTKQQILTDYLNIAYFNEGIYGIGTAAEYYFGVPIQKVTLAQAALLAGLINNPAAYDPTVHPQASTARRNAVLAAVLKYKMLPAEVVAAAKKTKVAVHVTKKAVGDPCPAAAPAARVFCAYALNQLRADPKLGATTDERAAKIYEGGLVIHTTYDPSVQQAVDTGIADHVPDTIRQIDTAVVEQPGTGAVLAVGQNRPYGTAAGQSTVVYASSPSYNVGSTFKAATLTAALLHGVSPTTHIASPACFTSKTLLPGYYSNTDGKASCPHGVSNAGDSETCDCDLYSGTWASVNTFYVQLEMRIGGPGVVASVARRLGVIGSSTFQDGQGVNESLTLGSGGGFSAFDVANMYATLDAHGRQCTASGVSSISTLTGVAVPFTGSVCQQAIPPSVADEVTSILQGVLTMHGATGVGLGIGRPAAGKTGTVDDSDEAWFVGYVPQLVTAVGVFDPKNTSSPATPITDIALDRTYVGGDLFGADIPGHTWQSIMLAAVAGLPVADFSQPEANDPAPVAPKPTTSASKSAGPKPSNSPSTPTTSSSGGLPTGGVTETVTPTSGLPTSPAKGPPKKK